MRKVIASSTTRIVTEARKSLGLRVGEKVVVVVRGKRVIVLPKPRSYRKAIRGLAKTASHLKIFSTIASID